MEHAEHRDKPAAEYNKIDARAQRRARWMHRRKHISDIIEVGSKYDFPSRAYDIVSTLLLLINVTVTMMYTFDSMEQRYGPLLLTLEAITVAFFAVDYALRVWSAPALRPNAPALRATWKYVISFTGIIDLLSFLPYYLPIFFPAGAAVFRLFRVVRIFRLFQINAYYDSLNVITEVIARKRQQIVSAVFLIAVRKIAASLCM